MANSGGGAVVVPGHKVQEEPIHEHLDAYAEPEFEAFGLHDIVRGGQPVTAIVVDSVAGTPLVFSRQGRYQDAEGREHERGSDRKSTRLNSSHVAISYAVFCLKKKK